MRPLVNFPRMSRIRGSGALKELEEKSKKMLEEMTNGHIPVLNVSMKKMFVDKSLSLLEEGIREAVRNGLKNPEQVEVGILLGYLLFIIGLVTDMENDKITNYTISTIGEIPKASKYARTNAKSFEDALYKSIKYLTRFIFNSLQGEGQELQKTIANFIGDFLFSVTLNAKWDDEKDKQKIKDVQNVVGSGLLGLRGGGGEDVMNEIQQMGAEMSDRLQSTLDSDALQRVQIGAPSFLGKFLPGFFGSVASVLAPEIIEGASYLWKNIEDSNWAPKWLTKTMGSIRTSLPDSAKTHIGNALALGITAIPNLYADYQEFNRQRQLYNQQIEQRNKKIQERNKEKMTAIKNWQIADTNALKAYQDKVEQSKAEAEREKHSREEINKERRAKYQEQNRLIEFKNDQALNWYNKTATTTDFNNALRRAEVEKRAQELNDEMEQANLAATNRNLQRELEAKQQDRLNEYKYELEKRIWKFEHANDLIRANNTVSLRNKEFADFDEQMRYIMDKEDYLKLHYYNPDLIGMRKARLAWDKAKGTAKGIGEWGNIAMGMIKPWFQALNFFKSAGNTANMGSFIPEAHAATQEGADDLRQMFVNAGLAVNGRENLDDLYQQYQRNPTEENAQAYFDTYKQMYNDGYDAIKKEMQIKMQDRKNREQLFNQKTSTTPPQSGGPGGTYSNQAWDSHLMWEPPKPGQTPTFEDLEQVSIMAREAAGLIGKNGGVPPHMLPVAPAWYDPTFQTPQEEPVRPKKVLAHREKLPYPKDETKRLEKAKKLAGEAVYEKYPEMPPMEPIVDVNDPSLYMNTNVVPRPVDSFKHLPLPALPGDLYFDPIVAPYWRTPLTENALRVVNSKLKKYVPPKEDKKKEETKKTQSVQSVNSGPRSSTSQLKVNLAYGRNTPNRVMTSQSISGIKAAPMYAPPPEPTPTSLVETDEREQKLMEENVKQQRAQRQQKRSVTKRARSTTTTTRKTQRKTQPSSKRARKH